MVLVRLCLDEDKVNPQSTCETNTNSLDHRLMVSTEDTTLGDSTSTGGIKLHRKGLPGLECPKTEDTGWSKHQVRVY